MNLTKDHRQQIVSAVMRDTPKRHKLDIQDRLQAIVDKAISERGPKGIAKLWKDKELGVYLRRSSTNAGYLCPRDSECYGYHSNLPYLTVLFGHEFPQDDPMRAEIDAIIGDYLDELAQRDAATKALFGALAGIRTRKQFLEQFPELEKYAPADNVTDRSVPAIANVMSTLSKLGWPADKAAATA